MTIEHYFNSSFQIDVAKLQFKQVPQVLKDILHEQDLVLFGGKNWASVQDDLAHIAPENRPRFVLCLLALVATDQCMQTHFKSHYAHWRAQTAYPKFGWTRFGLYNENPLKLLSVSDTAGLLDVAATCELMPEFVVFYQRQIHDYLRLHAPELTAEHFLGKLCHDAVFDLDEGHAVPAFKQAMRRWLHNANANASPGDACLLAA
jgi:hypothetical protein